jgi:hypothetical protein
MTATGYTEPALIRMEVISDTQTALAHKGCGPGVGRDTNCSPHQADLGLALLKPIELNVSEYSTVDQGSLEDPATMLP